MTAAQLIAAAESAGHLAWEANTQAGAVAILVAEGTTFAEVRYAHDADTLERALRRE